MAIPPRDSAATRRSGAFFRRRLVNVLGRFGTSENPRALRRKTILAIFLLSQTWTITVLLCNTNALSEAIHWIINQVTYSIIHWTGFGFGIALLITGLDIKKIRNSMDGETFKECLNWLLIIELFAVSAAFADFLTGLPDPYMLKQ